MTVSQAIRELTDFLAEHGDANLVIATRNVSREWDYHSTTDSVIVDYEDGTAGLVVHS